MKMIFIAALLVLSAGCASSPSSSSDGVSPGDRSILTFEEIEKSRTSNWSAYDLISYLRPEFFRSRGRMTLAEGVSTTAKVYLDGVAYGNIDQLRQFTAEHVFSVVFLNASDATTRFGMNNTAGAIVVTTR